MQSKLISQRKTKKIVTFYHDIEQDADSTADPKSCRQVVQQFLEIEKKYGISATYNVVGKLYQEQPNLIEWIKEGGGELSFHSYNHQPDWNETYFLDEIDLCRVVSPEIPGYRSPRSRINQKAVEHLWDKGFKWTAEDDYYNPEPRFIYKGLVHLPITDDDWDMHRGKMTIAEWLDKFKTFINERPYTAVGFHDSATVLSKDNRLDAWEKIIQMAVEKGLLILNFSETADLYRRAALERYYNQNADKWININKKLYRTRRFQELIRQEAEQLTNPVVVDFGCAGGLLASHLKDCADQIIGVDISEKMISHLDTHIYTPHLGDVTDSGLPSGSADLIICGRVVEYLFWPNRLAEEIKRIGKQGATYIAIFPAYTETPVNEGSPPDRIRRYFTVEEVKAWSKQIGPGKILGIQYEKGEPNNQQEEERFRDLEKNPPIDFNPLNWVWIGKVEEEYNPPQYRSVIPTSIVPFSFHKTRHDKLKSMIRKMGSFLPKNIKDIGKKILLRI